jgi:hypothetical protein
MLTSHRNAPTVPTPRLLRRVGHFLLHYFEMCLPMCVGFAVGDLAYFGIADAFGYREPFRQLPELSVVVVTFTMTAPMVAWMLRRGMHRRAIVEMSAAMPILALVLLVGGSLGLVARTCTRGAWGQPDELGGRSMRVCIVGASVGLRHRCVGLDAALAVAHRAVTSRGGRGPPPEPDWR